MKSMEQDLKRLVVEKYGGPNQPEQRLPTIYRVPGEMKRRYEEGNSYSYLPVAVQIGLLPYPRQQSRDEDYRVLELYKWRCVRSLIGRHHLLQEPTRTPELLRRCLSAINGFLPRILASYNFDAEALDVGQRHVVLGTMLLDGCFILRRLLKFARIASQEQSGAKASSSSSRSGTGSASSGGQDDDEDRAVLFGRCWVWSFVTCDLLLLENQIPFCVVQKLFHQLLTRTDADDTSDVLVAGALRLFSSLRPRKLYSSPISCRDVHVHHLLHLFYLSVGFPPDAAAAPDDDPSEHLVPPSELPQWIPCARELEEAGVTFRPRKDATSFLDVRFAGHGGVLEIPELQLYDYSEPLFRNLIAFEQTYPYTRGHVTAYAVFMDCLVTSPEDMRLLHLSGVLVNHMNRDRDPTGFFSRLCSEAHLAADRNYLAGVIGEVNRYRRSRWPRWRAALVRNYFSNPWVATSLAAAVILLALTMMQSFFAAYAYFKPPKQ